ncbi:unnamed protein product [Phaeothamnion confervicola]
MKRSSRTRRRPWNWTGFAALPLCLVLSRGAAHPTADDLYDSPNVFSPQGRLRQLEYAEEVVKKGNLCIGVSCSDGAVLAVQKLTLSEIATLIGEEGSGHRIYPVDRHIGLIAAGLPADGRALARCANELARAHRREYGEPIAAQVLADQMAAHLHSTSLQWNKRPYPNALLIASYDVLDEDESCAGKGVGSGGSGSSGDGRDGIGGGDNGSSNCRSGGCRSNLYVVQTSGVSHRWRACCIGLGSAEVRTQLVKWKAPAGITCGEAVSQIAALARQLPEGMRGQKNVVAELEVATVMRSGFRLLSTAAIRAAAAQNHADASGYNGGGTACAAKELGAEAQDASADKADIT